ncbi:beta-2 adrenergic receptor [Elysia marginata]|uniref:Beta-2 adrenergic receptor n=1 Tax=Elysia marginata TaxID=1093978 RepID=A0AAV4F3H7_9GAST|nr:beta-2 adrenergic receptor [Elysia marginata]
MNSTQASDPALEDTTIRPTDVCLFFIALCLALFIMSANATTVLAIWRTPGLRTLANTYVCSLACSDLVVGGVCVLLALYMLPPLRVNWFDRSGNLCSLLNGLNIGMTVVSAFSMTLIAFDRYLYIIKPYFYQRNINIQVIGISIALVWIAGLVVAFLPQFIARDGVLCHITDRLPVWYLFHLCTILYLLTCVVNILLYTVILKVACRQRNAVMATVVSVQNTKPGELGKAGGTSSKISKGTMKSIKFFLTVFGCFFCCITPMVVVLALDIYVSVPTALYRLLNVVALLNSAMNFLIYAAMNLQFRQAFLKTSSLARVCESCVCSSRVKGQGGDIRCGGGKGGSCGDGCRERTGWSRGKSEHGTSGASVVSYIDA